MNAVFRYRPEIDGLRALAVLPIMFFHAGFEVFGGGFIGVDIFFVISGFLITSIIYEEIENNGFSFECFFERRVRRIFPALFLVISFTVAISWIVMPPSMLKSLSQSLVSTSLFSSNLLFWKTNNYFAKFAELKPLLHTWSLSVEEQYYILFPFVLIYIHKCGRFFTICALLLIVSGSFLAAQFLTILDANSSFYLLPTRAWELMVGALSAIFLKNEYYDSVSRPARQVLGLIGLIMICCSVITFNHLTPHPSIYTLAPVIGAAMIIVCASEGTVCGKILSNHLFVAVGLLSYSAYLWHHVLFALVRIISPVEPDWRTMVFLIVLSFVLAYLSWRYVEKPFRNRTYLTRKSIFRLASGAIAVFVIFGIFGHITGGFPTRFTERQREFMFYAERSPQDNLREYGLDRCLLNEHQSIDSLFKNKCVSKVSLDARRVLILGDSEAAHLLTGVDRFFKNNGYVVEQWTSVGCTFFYYSKMEARCSNFYDKFFNNVALTLKSHDIVIVSSRWIGAFYAFDENTLLSGFNRMLHELHKTQARLIVIGNTPEFYHSPAHILLTLGHTDLPLYSLQSLDFIVTNNTIRQAVDNIDGLYFDPSTVLCDNIARLKCTVMNERQHLYMDTGHLSPYGSEYVIRGLLNHLHSKGVDLFGSVSVR